MQTIKGCIRHIIYTAPSSFMVAVFKVKEASEEIANLKNRTITVAGTLLMPSFEDNYLLTGEYTYDERYGDEFKFNQFQKLVPEGKDAVIEFLTSPLIKGCGEKTATAIVESLGEDALNIIKNNRDCLLSIPGISVSKADRIYTSILKYSMIDDILISLQKKGFSMSEATKIINKYEDKTLVFLEENMYLFKEFVPFKKIDSIYLSDHEFDTEVRIKACLVETMEELSDKEGHTYYTEGMIKENILKSYGIELNDTLFDKYVLNNHDIYVEDDRIYLLKYYDMEVNIARRLKSIYNASIREIKNIDKKIIDFEHKINVIYNEEQKQAIKTALESKISIISGGPGTGKTTIIKAITSLYSDIYKLSGIDKTSMIALLAPTGRAAKKLSLSTGLPSSTIHRFLKWNKDTDTFSVNRENPNLQKLIIVDECSMIDTNLFSSLLDGILDNVQLVLVGDTFQLPSVSSGMILEDLKQSKIFPFTSLETIYRQSNNSYIPFLAKEIREDKIGDTYLEKKDDYNFISCSKENIKPLLEKIIRMCLDKGLNTYDIEVLAPMYKGENGIDNLNKLLQGIFNPHDPLSMEVNVSDVTYRVGDKVLQLVNNPDTNVFNGDIGYIERIYTAHVPKTHLEVVINFDGNRVIYKKEDLTSIKHAYAITIHKSQGSEFPHVIMPLTTSYKKMLYNKLIYTGVSRAKNSLIIIGEEEAFLYSVHNNYADNRLTSLKLKLWYIFDKNVSL